MSYKSHKVNIYIYIVYGKVGVFSFIYGNEGGSLYLYVGNMGVASSS